MNVMRRINKKKFLAIILTLILAFNHTVIFANPPERPSGEMPNFNGENPPERSSGERPNFNGENPPERPSGERPDFNGENPPDKPNGDAPGGNSGASNISHVGATEISSDTTSEGGEYSSTKDSQNAVLVTDGTSTISNPTINKTGDAEGDSADFYGTNAAVLVKKGTLTIDGGTVSTNGSHANGVFAYANGIIHISNTNIKTQSNNSGAIMVTGGGTLTANNVIAETDGNSSAPIRSDRGGGNLTVNGGTYTSHGTGSPAIYSTANIVANDSTLISTASEGVVVEGKNSITLNNVTMESTNTKLNGNSETYKSIFLYQSMSQDAEIGTASFTANNSTITNNKGDIIYVTNTDAVIHLENNTINNNDAEGCFLKIGASKWGTSGSNGGNVELNASNQKIEGDIIVDDISTLAVSLKDGSSYVGTMNGENMAKTMNVIIDSNSTFTLTGDSYISSLVNEKSDNSNIHLNGHKLFVNGIELFSNGNESTNNENSNQGNDILKIVIIVFAIALVVAGVIVICKKKGNHF